MSFGSLFRLRVFLIGRCDNSSNRWRPNYRHVGNTDDCPISDTISDHESLLKRWVSSSQLILRTTNKDSLTQDSSLRSSKNHSLTFSYHWETLHLCWIVMAIVFVDIPVPFAFVFAFTLIWHDRHDTRSHSQAAWRLLSMSSSSSLL